jgi:hypothetical protein
VIKDFAACDRIVCGGIDVGARTAGCAATGSAALAADDPALEAMIACVG